MDANTFDFEDPFTSDSSEEISANLDSTAEESKESNPNSVEKQSQSLVDSVNEKLDEAIENLGDYFTSPVDPEEGDAASSSQDDIETLSEEEIREIEQMAPERNVYYKTSDVAKRLGVTDQLIRHYCYEFDEFLDIDLTEKKGPGFQQRRFQQKDIEMLANIMDIKARFHFTLEQTKDFLRNNEQARLAIRPPEQRMEMMLSSFRSTVHASISEALQPYLEQRSQEMNNITEQYRALLSSLAAKDQQIEALSNQNKAIQDQLAEQRSIIEEQHELNTQILEKLNQPKKRFFGFGRD